MENNKRKINGLILVAVVIIVAIYARPGGETVTGYLDGTPSSSEVKQLIDTKVATPGCANSTLFKEFPVTLSTSFHSGISEHNHSTFDAFVNVGLLQKNGPLSYDLTEAGRSDYRADIQSFCFASGYQVTNVKDISRLRADQIGVAVEAGWLAIVEIAPKDLKPWITNPVLKQINYLTAEHIDKATRQATYRTFIMKLKGEKNLTVQKLGFSFETEVSFFQSF